MMMPLLSATIALALAPVQSPAQKTFARLKQLAGTWEGKAGHGSEPMNAKVIYKVTGGGSALMETQFPGSPHEMMTVYHLDGDKLVLTHYCAAQNQPRMRFVPGANPSVLKFDFAGGTNMKPTDGHMHSLTMRLVDADHVVSEWTYFSNGKAGSVAKFDMHRVK